VIQPCNRIDVPIHAHKAGDYNSKTRDYSDVLIHLKLRKHPRLELKDNMLTLSHNISLYEAIHGVVFKYVHLDDKTYIIKTATTKPIIGDTTFYYPNMGINGKELFVKFAIVFPEIMFNEKNELAQYLGKRDFDYRVDETVITLIEEDMYDSKNHANCAQQ
jgi:DnaJ-class molecular chaperone